MPAFQSPTVAELELELKNIRSAFEEYISSSREVEDGMDLELTDMHTKLKETQDANDAMSSRLETIEPMLQNLEVSMTEYQTKLADEQQKRIHAENRFRELQDRCSGLEERIEELQRDNEALQDECDAAHEELAFKCNEIDEMRDHHERDLQEIDEQRSRLCGVDRDDRSTTGRSVRTDAANIDNTTRSSRSSQIDDSYTEILAELENVTEQFIKTQQKLWETEDILRELEGKANEGETVRGSSDLDSSQLGTDVLQIENENIQLRKKLSEMTNDYSVLCQEQQDCTQQLSSCKDQLARCRKQLSSKTREIEQLCQHPNQATSVMEKTQSHGAEMTGNSKDKEILLLRARLKEVFRENISLKDKVDQHQVLQQKISELEKERLCLQQKLRLVNDVDSRNETKAHEDQSLGAAAASSRHIMEANRPFTSSDAIYKQLKSLEKSYAALLEEHSKSQGDLTAANQRHADILDALAHSETIVQDLQADLAQTRDELETANNKLRHKGVAGSTDRGLELLNMLLDTEEASNNAADPPSADSVRRERSLNIDGEDVENLVAIRSRLEELIAENHTLRDSLSRSQDNFENETRRLRTTIFGILKSHPPFDWASLHDQLDKTRKEFLESDRLRKVMSTRLEDLTRERDALSGRVSALQFEIDQGKASAQRDNDKQRAEHQNEIMRLQDAMNNLTGKKSQIEKALEESRLALSTAECSKENLKNEIQSRESRIQFLEEKVEELQQQVGGFEKRMVESAELHKTQVEAARQQETDSRVSSLLAEAIMSDKNALHSEGDILGLVAELSSLRKELKARECDLLSKERSASSLKQQLEESQAALESALNMNKNLQSEILKCRREYDCAVKELETIHDVVALEKQNARIEARKITTRELREEMKALLENERKRMLQSMETAKEENVSLRRQLMDAQISLESDIGSRQRKEVSHQREVDGLGAEVNSLKKQLSAANNELGQKCQEALELRAKCACLEKDLADAHARVLDMQREHRNANKGRGESTTESHRAHLTQEFPSFASSAVASNLSMKVEIMEMDISLKRLAAEKETLTEELHRTRKEEVRISEMYRSLQKSMNDDREKEMEQFREQFQSLVQNNAAIQKLYENCKSELDETKGKLTQISLDYSKAGPHLQAITEENEGLKDEIVALTNELETTNEDHEAVLAELREEFQSEASEYRSQVEGKISVLSERNKKLLGDVARAENELSQERQRRNSLQAEIQSLESNLRSSQGALIELEKEISALTESLQAESSAHLQTQQRHEEKAAVMEETVCRLEKLNTKMKEDLAKKDAYVADQQRKYTSLEETCSKLELSLRISREEISAHKKEAERREEAHAALISSTKDSSNEVLLLRERIERLTNERADLQKKLDEAMTSLSVSQYSLERSKEDYIACQEQLRAARHDAVSMQKSLTNEDTEIQAASKVIDRIHSILENVVGKREKIGLGVNHDDSLEERLSLTLENITTFMGDFEKLRADSQKIVSSLDALSTTFSGGAKQERDLPRAVESLAQEYTSLKEDLAASHEDLRVKNLNLSIVKAQYDELKKQAKNSSHTIERLRTLLKSTRKMTEVADTNDIKKGLKVIKEDEKRELVAEFRRLYEENQCLRGQVQELSDKNLDHELAAGLGETDSIKNVNKALQSKVEEYERVIVDIQSRYQELERAFFVLRDQADQETIVFDDEDQVEHPSVIKELKRLAMATRQMEEKVAATEDAVADIAMKHKKYMDSLHRNVQTVENLDNDYQKIKQKQLTRDQEVAEVVDALASKVSEAEDGLHRIEQKIDQAADVLKVSNYGVATKLADSSNVFASWQRGEDCESEITNRPNRSKRPRPISPSKKRTGQQSGFPVTYHPFETKGSLQGHSYPFSLNIEQTHTGKSFIDLSQTEELDVDSMAVLGAVSVERTG